MRIHDLDLLDKPQEKLLKYGVDSLTDVELLAIILRSGTRKVNVLEVCEKVIELLRTDLRIHVEELQKIRGIGPVRACQILASIELSRRYLGSTEGKVIENPEDIVEVLKYLQHTKQEHCIIVTLDSSARIIKSREVSKGILNANIIHPREVFAPAIEDRAASIVIVHNHPSGTVHPSDEDIKITKVLQESSQILGIPIQDHIIIGKSTFFSFAEKHLLGS